MALSKRKESTKSKKGMIVTYFNSDSPIAEQYRTIRTNILFAMGDLKSRILLVTSPSAGEGKSTTVANLAVSMAQQKEKVLLIDGNLRNPSVHSLFKIPNDVGLTSVLTGRLLFEETVFHTGLGRLDVLSSGPSTTNSAELFSSQLMLDLLKKSLQTYNVILIDSPAVLEVSDTILLADHCDGVILVLNHGKTQLEKAVEAKKILEFAKAKFVGAIFNEKK